MRKCSVVVMTMYTYDGVRDQSFHPRKTSLQVELTGQHGVHLGRIHRSPSRTVF